MVTVRRGRGVAMGAECVELWLEGASAGWRAGVVGFRRDESGSEAIDREAEEE